jgi:hypothetical protein
MLLPKRAAPKRLVSDPIRETERRERLLPAWRKSKTDNRDPMLTLLKTLAAWSVYERANPRRESADPRCMLFNTLKF